MQREKQIEQLLVFKIRDKFSTEAWNARGLNPSPPEVRSKLKSLFDDCSQCLIVALQENKNKKKLKSILKVQLGKFIETEYDTEEREFICDLFFDLSKILEIEFKNEISIWLYGKRITFMNHLFRKKDQILEVYSQTCDKCTVKLESFVMEKEESIPEMDWMIVQCDNCKEFNLLDIGPNIKTLKFGKYKMIESFPKTEYSSDQAKVRLEQIRTFRHN